MDIVEREIVGDMCECAFTQHLNLADPTILIHCQTKVASFRASYQIPTVLRMGIMITLIIS